MSGKAASKEQFYVSASRGKFAISIHTDDKDNLLHSVQRSTKRMIATEVAEKEPKTKVIGIKDKLKKMGSIYKAVKSKFAKGKQEVENARKIEDKKVINIKPKPEPQKQVTHAIPRQGRAKNLSLLFFPIANLSPLLKER